MLRRLRTNKSVFNQLGADLNVYSNTFRTYFLTPSNKKIYITFDTCHLEKNVRNAIGDKKLITDGNNGKISWQYFQDLVKHKKLTNNLHASHKMTLEHLRYATNKMRVSLAVQTLSRSTAESMQFLKDQGVTEFLGCDATVKFVLLFDKLFDIFNSKSFFPEAKTYLKALTLKENDEVKLICQSLRSAGFAGYIINMTSLEQMYADYVDSNEMTKLPYLPTFHFSQDHLETYFSICRSKHGFNDNPTVEQFTGRP